MTLVVDCLKSLLIIFFFLQNLCGNMVNQSKTSIIFVRFKLQLFNMYETVAHVQVVHLIFSDLELHGARVRLQWWVKYLHRNICSKILNFFFNNQLARKTETCDDSSSSSVCQIMTPGIRVERQGLGWIFTLEIIEETLKIFLSKNETTKGA